MHKVPVYNSDGEYLSHSDWTRINRWLSSGKAVKQYDKGEFSVRLTSQVKESTKVNLVDSEPFVRKRNLKAFDDLLASPEFNL